MTVLKIEHGQQRRSHIDKYDEMHYVFVILGRVLADLGDIKPMDAYDIGIKFYDDGNIMRVDKDNMDQGIQDLYDKLKAQSKEERLKYRDTLIKSLNTISKFKL